VEPWRSGCDAGVVALRAGRWPEPKSGMRHQLISVSFGFTTFPPAAIMMAPANAGDPPPAVDHAMGRTRLRPGEGERNAQICSGFCRGDGNRYAGPGAGFSRKQGRVRERGRGIPDISSRTLRMAPSPPGSEPSLHGLRRPEGGRHARLIHRQGGADIPVKSLWTHRWRVVGGPVSPRPNPPPPVPWSEPWVGRTLRAPARRGA
jgi:hypothetical protein